MSVLSRVEALRRHVLSPCRRLSAARPRPSGRSLLLTLAPLRTPTDKEADPDADIDDRHVSDGDGDGDDEGNGGVLTSPGGLPLLRYWTGSRLAAREVTAGRFLSPRPAAAASPGGNLVAQLPLASPHTVHQPSRAPVAMTACPPRVSSWTCWRRVHLADGRCCSCRRCGAVRGAGGCGGVLGASECCSAEERLGASGGGARDCAPPGHAADLVHESSTASDTHKDASTSTSPDR